ncbi:MAG TPA: EscJ/YscJ/HrcJ family type III secretion inner membrane ring protein, partial [Gammaproteobacteria bacterium]|nr:EscJ/YscJ/HrcJ family type III secretion inner membrane ring protein [Gammaproteobacteria bacterium]
MCKNSEKAVRLSAVVRSRSRWPAWRGVVLVGVVMLLSACRVDLYTKVPENDANEMLAALLRSSVDAEKVAEKKSDSFTIRVEESQIPAAIAILKDHGFPRENFATFGELFKKEGLISSPLEERVRFIYALSQNVQETLSRIDGVVTARVHIV